MLKGAFGQLEIFDLSPSTTRRFTNIAAEGGTGGAGGGGLSNGFNYHKNVGCKAPIITELYPSQPLPFSLQLTFSGTYTDDIRLTIDGETIQDWRRCGNNTDSIQYFGPIHPGATVGIDTFVQCARSGHHADWSATIAYLSGSSLLNQTFSRPGGLGTYFPNTGYASQRGSWVANGGFNLANEVPFEAWPSAQESLVVIQNSPTGTSTLAGESFFGIPESFSQPDLVGTGVLHHFKPGLYYQALAFSRSPLNYRATILEDEVFTNDLMMESGLRSYENAWISYDVTSGFESKIVSAYSIALIDSITGNSIKFSDGGTEIIGDSPYSVSGFCQQISAIINNTGSGCQDPDDLPDELSYCVTGSGSAELQAARSGILEIMKSFGQNVKITLPDVEDFGMQAVTGSYYYYTGSMAYNFPNSGDTICFENYVFADGKDYTGEYSGVFGHVPPHPDINFCISYPQDYSNIDSLVSVLNSKLSGNHYVWYQYPCTENQYDGYYENTGIMEFTKLDNNTIGFKSVLVGPAGKHKWNFGYVGEREETAISYLLPSTILFQGSNDHQNWSVLDSHYDIDWSKVTPTTGTKFFSYFMSGGHVSDDPDKKDDHDNEPTVKGTIAQELGTLTGSGTTKCGTSFETLFHIKIPLDPTGCPIADDDDKDKPKDDPDKTGTGEDPNKPGVVSYSQLKVGYKFNNDTPYNYYRVFFDGFEVAPDGSDNSVSGFFAVTNINLFGVKPADHHLTAEACLIGADYTVDVQAETTGIITGRLSGHADASTSGKVVWKQVLVTGVPNGNGHVKFQTELGVATEPFEALISHEIVGHGTVYDETGGFYLYDPVAHSLYAPPRISGEVTGCGMISGGPYYFVGANHKPYMIGGPELDDILVGLSEYVVQTYTFDVTGYLPNVAVPGFNIPSFGYLTGMLSGVVGPNDSGYYNFDTGIAGVPAVIYSNVVDYFDNMFGVINMPATANMHEGDSITINGIPLIYTTGTTNHGTTYFSNADDFNQQIGNNISGFQTISYALPHQGAPTSSKIINVLANVSGDAGNDITFSSQGINPPTWTLQHSGKTFYQTLDAPMSVFQGQMAGQVAAVSYFNNVPAEGYISGVLNYISQYREFSGMWDLKTGIQSYLRSGWLMDGYIYKRPNTVPQVVFNSPGAFGLAVSYLGNAEGTAPDVATLRISGVNFDEVLEFNITGHK